MPFWCYDRQRWLSIIRGGAENDEGFELEGIDATEPVTGTLSTASPSTA